MKTEMSKLLNSIRDSNEYTVWRNEIVKRDRRCVCCGANAKDVHHVRELKNIVKCNKIKTIEQAISSKDVFDIKNGILVCKACHREIHNSKQIVVNGRYYKEVVQCHHSYIDAQGVKGGFVFQYCTKCGSTRKNK
jgi:hypothetical protein